MQRPLQDRICTVLQVRVDLLILAVYKCVLGVVQAFVTRMSAQSSTNRG